MSTTTQKTSTIIYFHVGRGGRFYNAGHRSFCGAKRIDDILRSDSTKGNWAFVVREHASEVRKKIEHLPNLLELFEKCQDNNDDFTEFEKRTGLELGELVYVTGSGGELITVAEAETGVGIINWDGAYDTDICMHLEDADEEDLTLIANSNEWSKENLLKEYFDNHTDLKIDWAKFDGNFKNLVYEYFNFSTITIEDFYTESED